MKLKYLRIPFIIMLLITVFVVSCKDEWDNHFYTIAANKSELNLYQYIQSRSELSKFSEMLKVTGYDSILSQSNTYTVWAPNNTALEGVDIHNMDLVTKIVQTHITRFSYTTAGLSSLSILMLNNKFIPFAQSGSGFTFGGKTILEPNLATANGIVHILGEYVLYRKNIWEFISQTDGLDSLRAYINSQTTLVLDSAKSFQDGVFVDSVKKETNFIFTNLAAINTEDSIYTAILPNNDAWTEAYNRITPYYKTLNKDGGSSFQQTISKLILIKDLFFKGKITTPVTQDSIESTIGTVFHNPSRLFSDGQVNEMSNGLSYVSSKLNYTASESWFKEIRIEAEWANYGRITSNYATSVVSSIGTGYNVSSKYYLTLVPTTSSSISQLFVNFPLPNTLSAKYNIYCVILPTRIVDTADVKPNKVKFYLSYVNSTGTQVTNAAIDANNEVLSPAGTSATFTTDPTKINKILVAKDFEFPYSNLTWDVKDPTKPITVALKVLNAVKPTESTFNRTLRIDCIILEPVQ